MRDPWRLAFDALLSRPENFPQAGALRLCHDNHGLRGASIVTNLCAVRLTGTDGLTRVLVLNYQPVMMRPSLAGDLAYYLFDEEGRFLRGGVYAIAPHHTAHVISAHVEAGSGVAVMFAWGSFGTPSVALHFALADDDLALRGSTDEGAERNAEDTQHLPESPDGPAVERRYSFPAR